jgi:hypothetical protein
MIPGRKNIELISGDDFTLELLFSINGTPINFTGWSAEMDLRRKATDPAELLTLTSANGKITLDSSGHVNVIFSSVDTALLNGNTVYSLQLTNPSSKKSTYMIGNICFIPDVTR